MRYPSELYCASPRLYHGLEELEYPFHDRTITVTHCGRICLGKHKINLSQGAWSARRIAIERGLLLPAVLGGWFGRFFLQPQMHALVPTVLLRMAWLDAFNRDAQSQPQLIGMPMRPPRRSFV
jgi:hypothetical protein